MQIMSQHFDVWGHLYWKHIMNRTISSMDAFPGGGVFVFAVSESCARHKTTPLAASLIAHRTSNTEKNNNFKNCTRR